MAVKPVRCKVYVEEGDGSLVYVFKDENVLHQLWNAVKYTESKTGFVTGWGWCLGDPNGNLKKSNAKQSFFSINIYKITCIEWDTEEIEETSKFFF